MPELPDIPAAGAPEDLPGAPSEQPLFYTPYQPAPAGPPSWLTAIQRQFRPRGPLVQSLVEDVQAGQPVEQVARAAIARHGLGEQLAQQIIMAARAVDHGGWGALAQLGVGSQVQGWLTSALGGQLPVPGQGLCPGPFCGEILDGPLAPGFDDESVFLVHGHKCNAWGCEVTAVTITGVSVGIPTKERRLKFFEVNYPIEKATAIAKDLDAKDTYINLPAGNVVDRTRATKPYVLYRLEQRKRPNPQTAHRLILFSNGGTVRALVQVYYAIRATAKGSDGRWHGGNFVNLQARVHLRSRWRMTNDAVNYIRINPRGGSASWEIKAELQGDGPPDTDSAKGTVKDTKQHNLVDGKKTGFDLSAKKRVGHCRGSMAFGLRVRAWLSYKGDGACQLHFGDGLDLQAPNVDKEYHPMVEASCFVSV